MAGQLAAPPPRARRPGAGGAPLQDHRAAVGPARRRGDGRAPGAAAPRPAPRGGRPGRRRSRALPGLDDLVDRPGARRLLAPGRVAERPPGRRLVARALGPDAALPPLCAALAPARSGRVAVGRVCHRVDRPMGRRGRSAAGPDEGRRARARRRRGLDRAGTDHAPAEAPARRDRGAEGLAPQRDGTDRRADPQGGPGDPGARPARHALLHRASPRLEGHPQRPAARHEGLARARGRRLGPRRRRPAPPGGRPRRRPRPPARPLGDPRPGADDALEGDAPRRRPAGRRRRPFGEGGAVVPAQAADHPARSASDFS